MINFDFYACSVQEFCGFFYNFPMMNSQFYHDHEWVEGRENCTCSFKKLLVISSETEFPFSLKSFPINLN